MYLDLKIENDTTVLFKRSEIQVFHKKYDRNPRITIKIRHYRNLELRQAKNNQI